MTAPELERGREQWESYYSVLLQGQRVRYYYRTPDGHLYSCVGRTVDDCRRKRDAWLAVGQQGASLATGVDAGVQAAHTRDHLWISMRPGCRRLLREAVSGAKRVHL